MPTVEYCIVYSFLVHKHIFKLKIRESIHSLHNIKLFHESLEKKQNREHTIKVEFGYK